MNRFLSERMNDGMTYSVCYKGKIRNVKFLADGSNLARGFIKVEQLFPETGIRTLTVAKIGTVTLMSIPDSFHNGYGYNSLTKEQFRLFQSTFQLWDKMLCPCQYCETFEIEDRDVCVCGTEKVTVVFNSQTNAFECQSVR